MPTTVAEIFSAANLKPTGVVTWGQPVPETGQGVYVVALTDDRDSLAGALALPPLDRGALKQLKRVCPELRIDAAAASGAAIGKRVSGFWLPDEVVLYIGLAGQPLRTRVRQYYMTPLGAKRPHKGGWWLKTLGILDELWVHYAPTPDYAEAEKAMLRSFADGVSATTRADLLDSGCAMPWANLRGWDNRIKGHRITGATTGELAMPNGARSSTPARTAKAATLAPPRPRPRTRASAPSPGGAASTQRVTETDLAAGRIRLPRSAKHLLPADKADVGVSLRGTALRARWDPRMGPPERSGVLGFGRSKLDTLVDAEDVLSVAVEDGHIRLR
jgi:hypothetical protein